MALRLHPGLENVTSLSSLHSDADKTKRRMQSFKKSPLWGLASFIDAFILLFSYLLSYNCFTLSLYWVQTNWGAFTSLRNLIPSAFWRCSHFVQILLLQETLSALHASEGGAWFTLISSRGWPLAYLYCSDPFPQMLKYRHTPRPPLFWASTVWVLNTTWFIT